MFNVPLYEFLAEQLGLIYEMDTYRYVYREFSIPAEEFRVNPLSSLKDHCPVLYPGAERLYLEWASHRPVAACQEFQRLAKIKRDR